MTRQQQPARQGNVVALNPTALQPSRTRLDVIQQWHQDKAACQQDKAVAAIHISITAAGVLQTEGVCIEPEHAQAILEAIPNLISRLETTAANHHTKSRPHPVHQLMARGFRNHPDKLGPSILWMPNGSGKTGALDALIALKRART